MGLFRFLLALSVIAAHTKPAPTIFPFFGGEGVTPVLLFFVISGFYMAMIVEEKYASNLQEFYENRFLRLFPIYWTLLGIFVSLCLIYSVIINPVGPFYTTLTYDFAIYHYIWALVANI